MWYRAGKKKTVYKQSKKWNEERQMTAYASIPHAEFFQRISGSLIMTGRIAADTNMVIDLIKTEREKNDIPTIIFSSHPKVFVKMKEDIDQNNLYYFCPGSRYNPFYNMPFDEMITFIGRTADEIGFHMLKDKILLFTNAITQVLKVDDPVSLHSIQAILTYDDEEICHYAQSRRLSQSVADIIISNPEAGNALRVIIARIRRLFTNVTDFSQEPGTDIAGLLNHKTPCIMFYPLSCDQKLMNTYLRQELFWCMNARPKIRVIADEIPFSHSGDSLIESLFQMNQQRRIELCWISQNILSLHDQIRSDSFDNTILSIGSSKMETDLLSKTLFGEYSCHVPIESVSTTPSDFITTDSSRQWGTMNEQRLRVMTEDLTRRNGYVAVQTTANPYVYLIDRDTFAANEKLPITTKMKKLLLLPY